MPAGAPDTRMSASRPDSMFSLRPVPDPEAPAPPSAAPGPEDELSVLALVNVLLRRRKLVFIPPLVLVIWAFLWPLIKSERPPLPQSEAVLTIEGGVAASPTPAEGLAAQLGLVAAASANTTFPYPRILASRDFLNRLLNQPFSFDAGNGAVRSGTLFELSNIKSDTAGLARERAIRWLRGSLTVTGEPDGMARLKVRMPWKALAESLSYRVVDELNDANIRMRQTKVSRDRRATYTQMVEAQNDLRAAESRMEAFLLSNRDYQNSPMLRFQFDRINRDMNIKSALYTSLATSYQNARLEEIRNAPAVNIVEPPLVPFEEPKPPRIEIPTKALVQAMFALIATIILAYVLEFAAIARRRSPGDYDEFVTLREKTFGWLVRPLRRLRARHSSGDLKVQ